jgi:predicted transcriptional regulator
MISTDLTFMLTGSTIDAYSDDGNLLWSRDIGMNATRPFIDEQVWPYDNTLPLFSNGSLYVPVVNGTVKVGLDGQIKWASYVKDGGYTLFPLMPIDSRGNVYMAKIGQSPSLASLVTISSEGRVSDDVWRYAEYDDINDDPGMVPVGGNEGIVYAYESLGLNMYYVPESVFNETLSSGLFSADTITAYDVTNGKGLWNFTIPAADVQIVTLNKDNAENALLWDASIFAGESPTHPYKESDIRVYTGRNVTYVNYYYSIFDVPLVYNQSRCVYVRSIYALDNNGSLLWSKNVNGFVDKMAAGNTTIYYSLDNGRIGGSGANVVAGIAIAAVVYMFLRFFMLGTVARARSRLDENRNRRSLFQYIVDHPGVTAADMAKDLRMNMGTLRYHLLILSLNHKVVMHKDAGKFLRYFKNSGAYTDSEKVLFSMIRRKPLQKIVHALIEKQRLSSQDLAKELNISDKAIYRHIAELQENDIIEKFQGNDKNIVYSIKGERLDQIKRLMSRF